MTIGQRLARLRKEHHYTQEELAEHLGVSRQAVSKWESDAAYPETDKLIRISSLFCCSLDYLMKGQEEPAPTTSQPEVPPFPRPILPERKSEKTLWGLPLWHMGKDAHGIIAVGLKARGLIAVGLYARGLVSVGFASFGLVSFGFLALGVFALGLFAAGLAAGGCFALGFAAAGAISLGIISFGSIAIGDFCAGALAIGKYFAIGDHASAMIALGETRAQGSLFQKLGALTSEEVETVKGLLDTAVPQHLAWIRDFFKFFLRWKI